jgi:intein/homing endonuclease
MDFVESELKEHGVEANEALTLPEGRTLPSVLVGDAYMYKLHHLSEDKSSGVGAPGYSMSGVPTTVPGGDKPKRIGMLEVEGLLAHGATDVLRDIKMIRGTENREYFKDLMDGKNPPMPKISPVYKKFISTLQSAGIRVKPTNDNKSLQLTAMTDNDVDGMSAGEITKGESVKWKSTYSRDVHGDADLTPIDGGLFDRAITGGMGGNRFSHISLPVKLPQPVFEKQIRTLLDLKERELHGVLSGTHKLDGFGTGPGALEKALKHIDVDKEMESASSLYKASDKPSIRDTYAKKIRALKGIKGMGVKPSDLMVSKVLVIPPVFRPISITPDFEIISDANMLYQDLMDASDNYKQLSELAGSDLSGEALDNMYKAYKAVTGLGEPVKKERVQKHVQGLLKDIFGPSGNKTSVVQRNLIGTPTSFSARGVITPDVNLSMDEIGLPEEKMWELFEPFIVRRLMKGVDKSDPVGRKKVLEDVKERRGNARQALLDEAKERPVVYSRAPVLHKYGVLAGFAQPVPGNAIRVSPITEPGLNADHDGDLQIQNVILAVKKTKFLDLIQHFMLTPLIGQCYSSFMNTDKAVPVLDEETHVVCMVDLEDFPHENEIETIDGKNGIIKTYNVPAGTKVLSYDEEVGRVVWKDVAVYSRHLQRKLEIVSLSNHRQIFTDDDPRAIYGIDPADSTLEYRRFTPSEALDKGVAVPCSRGLTDIISDGGVHTTVKITDDEDCSFKELPLNEETGWMLGVLAGDGWWDKERYANRRAIHIADNVGMVANRFTEYLQKHIIADNHNTSKWEFKKVDHAGRYGDTCRYSYRFDGSTIFSEFLTQQLGGSRDDNTAGSANKHLPGIFLNSPKEFRIGLLQGLMDTDGTCSVCNAKTKVNPQLKIQFSSTSLRMCREIQLLCRSLGVESSVAFSKKTTAGADSWVVYLSSPDCKRTGVLSNMATDYKRENVLNTPVKADNASQKYDKVVFPRDIADEIISLMGKLDDCHFVDEDIIQMTLEEYERDRINLYSAIYQYAKEGVVPRSIIRRTLELIRLKETMAQESLRLALRHANKIATEEYPLEITQATAEWLRSGVVLLFRNMKDEESRLQKKRITSRFTRVLKEDKIPIKLARDIAALKPRPIFVVSDRAAAWVERFVNTADIGWATVVSVEKTGEYVDGYDLCVPGTETFTSTDGVILSNTFNYHALVSPEAVENAKDTMLPSRHLFSESDFKLFHQPDHEFKMGLYRLGQKKNKGRTIMDRSFGSPEAVMEAYRRGEINLEDEVVVDEQ